MGRTQERVALNNEHKQKSQLSRGIALEKARAPGSIIQPLSPHAKTTPNAYPLTMNLAGTDMVLLTAAKKAEVNWWWTCCNTYNPRSGDRHYTELELASPQKIGSEDSRLSAEKLGREADYIAKTLEQNKPPVSRKGFCQPIPQQQLQQMPPMLSELFNKQRSRTSHPAARIAPFNSQSPSIMRCAPDINSSNRELSVGYHSGNTKSTFPGTRPAYRSQSVQLVGGSESMQLMGRMTGEWERQSVFMPRNEKMKPPGSRQRSRGLLGSVSYKSCGMQLTPAMLQPLPGSRALTPIAYRVPKMDPIRLEQQRPSPVQPSPAQLPTPSATSGQQQHRNFPANTDFSQIKPFSRLD